MADTLKYTYVGIHEGQTQLIKEEKLSDWYSLVESGEATVLRFIGFSDQAKAISGKEGRVEEMVAESSTEDEPEDASEDQLEIEPEVEWSIDWELVK